VLLPAVAPAKLWVMTEILSGLLVWMLQILFQTPWRAAWERTTTVRYIDARYTCGLTVAYVSKQHCALPEAFRLVVIVDAKFFE